MITFFSFPRKVLSLTVHCCLCGKSFFSCTGGVGNLKINLDANKSPVILFLDIMERSNVHETVERNPFIFPPVRIHT